MHSPRFIAVPMKGAITYQQHQEIYFALKKSLQMWNIPCLWRKVYCIFSKCILPSNLLEFLADNYECYIKPSWELYLLELQEICLMNPLEDLYWTIIQIEDSDMSTSTSESHSLDDRTEAYKVLLNALLRTEVLYMKFDQI